VTEQELQELEDRARKLADEMEAHKRQHKEMPDHLKERFSSLLAAFQETFPIAPRKTVPSGDTYAEAYRCAREMERSCEGQIRMIRVRPRRVL